MPQIYHLAGPGFSGRAVKLRELTPEMKDEAIQSAALEAGDNRPKFLTSRSREASCRMLVAVTEPMPDMNAVLAAKWKPLSLQDLEDKKSPLHFDKLFTPKDADVLHGVYMKLYEASPQEVEAIMGKAIPATD